MTKIIGHRGAAGLALENSKEGIKAALKLDVDVIEFDIHRTKDGKLVVLHDAHTGRVAKERAFVNSVTFAELQKIELDNGQSVPTLEETLDVIGSKPVIIDIKDEGVAEELFHIIDKYPKADISLASFKHGELKRIRQARPKIRVYILEHFAPLDIIQSAQRIQAHGIGLNKWLMNPLTYYLAERYGLELYVYTVNSVWLARFFQKLYPRVNICTDHPNRMSFLRKA